MLSMFFNQKNNFELNAPASDGSSNHFQPERQDQDSALEYQDPPKYHHNSEGQVYQMPDLPTEIYAAEVIPDITYDSSIDLQAATFQMPELPVETYASNEDSNMHQMSEKSEVAVYSMPEHPEPEHDHALQHQTMDHIHFNNAAPEYDDSGRG